MERYKPMEGSKPMEGKKPTEGTWEKMTKSGDKKPRIKFEFDHPVAVLLQCNEPREINWEDSVFYVFDVLCNGNEMAVVTSSWSLLRGLKNFEPLFGKSILITKKMVKGRQLYEVKENIEDVK
jgi:hypothetical protein